MNRRRTKSERDKRRSSRVSLLESKGGDSGSEDSSQSTEEKQPRYRKRAGSKRVVETSDNNINTVNNNNINNSKIKDGDLRRRRAGSKIAAVQHQQKEPVTEITDNITEQNPVKDVAVTTLKMNSKDIYFGTWNPTERAVLDQVLHNINLKPSDSKKHFFLNKLKNSKKDNPSPKQQQKEKCQKLDQEEDNTSLKYPLNRYNENEKHKKKIGIFRRFKDALRKSDDEILTEDQTQTHTGSPERPQQKKKSSIFKKRSKSTNNHEIVRSRHRAHSSNDYTRCVDMYVQSEGEENSRMPPTTNLSKSRSISTHSLKNLFSSSRAKSVDDLNGAFDYYANRKQVYQRAPSMNRLDSSKTTSMEHLDHTKRSGSHLSLSDHGFEPVKASAKELCYEENLVFARAKLVHPQTANQRRVQLPRQISSDGYYSDDYSRGYQSDWSPCYTSNGVRKQFTYDGSFSDTESFHMHPQQIPSYPNFLTPNQPRRMMYHHPHHPQPHHHHQQHPTNNSVFHQTPPMTSYYAPTYGTPSNYSTLTDYPTPSGYVSGGYASGYVTPGQQTGYVSESEYVHYHHLPQRICNHTPQNAKLAMKRSISKSSSNYGYMSESSFCEDEEDMYSIIHPSMNQKSITRTIPHQDPIPNNNTNVNSVLSTEV